MKSYVVRFVPFQDPRNALMQCEEILVTALDDAQATLQAKNSLPRSMGPDEISTWALRDESGRTVSGGPGWPR